MGFRPSKGALAQFAGKGAWVVLGQCASAIALVAGNRLLSELVSPEVFGTVSLLLGASALGLGVLCSPLLQAGLRFYPELERAGALPRLRKTLVSQLQKMAWIGLALLLLAGLGTTLVAGVPPWIIVILGAYLGLTIWRSLETSLLNAARRQRPFSLWTAMDALAQLTFGILFVRLLGPTALHVLLGYTVGTALVLAAFVLLLRREGTAGDDAATPEDRPMAPELMHYARPLIPLAVLGLVSSISDRYVISLIIGLRESGIYAAAYGLISRPFLMIQNTLELVMRPHYFAAVSQQSAEKAHRMMQLLLLATGTAGGLLLALVAAARGPLTRLLLAKDFGTAAELMPWIALGHLFLIVAYDLNLSLYARKQTRTILVVRAVAAAVTIIAQVALTWWMGVLGAALACPIYYGIEAFLLARVAKDVTHS